MKRYEEALADINQAIVLNSTASVNLSSRGFIYLRMKQFEKALEDFSRAIELSHQEVNSNSNSSLPGIYYFLRAITYKAIEQQETSEADLAVAIQIAQQKYEEDFSNLDYISALGLYYLAAGELGSAKLLYRQIQHNNVPRHFVQAFV